ncbi:MAG TPA: peptide chain release factor N(5)-glutamine methyltransferase [Candidatus Eisenbacteria bacterium]|nr:peptide chain release factor N(5)-glutamine methyltransferase [Candidatus Eisenbacteria bacterium]
MKTGRGSTATNAARARRPNGNSAGQSRAEALAALTRRFERAGIEAPGHDAEVLLLRALHVSRAELWSEPSALLTPEQAAELSALAERRTDRVPLQLLLGTAPFCSATLDLVPGVFIPRPETEALVEAVLRVSQPPRGTLLDLGTGTGAIAIALLHALPEWTGVAVDRSPAALALAARNAARNGVAGRLHLVEADFRDPDAAAAIGAEGPFELVVSNPPYIRSGDIAGLMPEVRDHDPTEALDGGPDGLDPLRDLSRGIPLWLRPGGIATVEIGADQADESKSIVGPILEDVRVLNDLAGRPRILIGTRGGGSA